MKKLIAGLLLSSAVAQVHATLDFYDSFNYSPAGSALATAGAANWTIINGGAAYPIVAAGSLSYPGLATASGDNCAELQGTGANGIAARQLGQVYNLGTATTLYYSLTFKVASIAAADWGGSSANYLNGSFMLGFSQKPASTTTYAQLDVAAPLLIRTGDPNNTTGTANDFQQYQLGIGATASTVTPNSRTFDALHNYNPGDTLFVVASYTFGPNPGDDVAKLWINPTPGSAEGDNTPVVTTALGLVDVNSSQIQSFYLRNNSVEPASTQVDNLRVGTAWADVTPVPEPSAAALLGVAALALVSAQRLRRR